MSGVAWVMRVLEVNTENGAAWSDDPMWIAGFDVDEFDGRGSVEYTFDVRTAYRFATIDDLFDAWTMQSQVKPRRTDGLPNKPLTAITIAAEQVHDERYDQR